LNLPKDFLLSFEAQKASGWSNRATNVSFPHAVEKINCTSFRASKPLFKQIFPLATRLLYRHATNGMVDFDE
jgi:hypothetical protein